MARPGTKVSGGDPPSGGGDPRLPLFKGRPEPRPPLTRTAVLDPTTARTRLTIRPSRDGSPIAGRLLCCRAREKRRRPGARVATTRRGRLPRVRLTWSSLELADRA